MQNRETETAPDPVWRRARPTAAWPGLSSAI